MKRVLAALGRLAVVALLPILSSCSQSSAAGVVNPGQKRESWDVYLLQDARVGYGRTTVRDVGSGREILLTENTSHLALRRGAEISRQKIRIASLETPAGKLLRFETEINMGSKPIRTTGRVNGNRLDIETVGDAAPVQRSIPWPSDVGGPFAVEQSLLRKPMKPGEQRKLKLLVAELQQVAEVEMAAKDFESAKLRTGPHNLLRIETVTRLADGQKIEQTMWTDRTGDVLKVRSPILGGLETHRVSKAEALEKTDAAAFDLLPSMMVKVETPLAAAHRTKEVRYRIHLDGSDPASVFIAGPTQAIKSIDAHTAEITVYAIRPGQSDGNRNAPADPPAADDLRPNVFVQSDDPLIVADAKKAAGDEKDPWRAAVALERFVNREVKNKNFSQTFASAAEVARLREGDCTEHAVFLTALCRARGIPARAAVGLVYMEDTGAFGYHLWTEVYVEKRWIPIDGMLARGGIGAAHLKIAQTSLKDATAYSAFLPVTQILGRLSIKIVDAK